MSGFFNNQVIDFQENSDAFTLQGRRIAYQFSSCLSLIDIKLCEFYAEIRYESGSTSYAKQSDCELDSSSLKPVDLSLPGHGAGRLRYEQAAAQYAPHGL